MKKYELFVKLELDIEWQIRVDIINFYKDYYNYLREVVKKPCIIINKNQYEEGLLKKADDFLNSYMEDLTKKWFVHIENEILDAKLIETRLNHLHKLLSDERNDFYEDLKKHVLRRPRSRKEDEEEFYRRLSVLMCVDFGNLNFDYPFIYLVSPTYRVNSINCIENSNEVRNEIQTVSQFLTGKFDVLFNLLQDDFDIK